MNATVRLHRNCSATPRFLMAALGFLVFCSLMLGLSFWFMGVPWVLPFAGLESAVVVIAFVVHARSVNDCEEMALDERTLCVRHERRGRVQEHRFERSRVRVHWGQGQHPPLRLAAAGREVEIGQWLRPAARKALYRQLQQDLPYAPAHECAQGIQNALSPYGVRVHLAP